LPWDWQFLREGAIIQGQSRTEEYKNTTNMSTKKVYIVIDRDPGTGVAEFKGVFFTEEAARKYIATKVPYGEIEAYAEAEDGTAKEI
jgi:hypothetical protein